jgi:hypothetical protein
MKQNNIFNKYPKTTLWVFIMLSITSVIFLMEVTLKYKTGLGTPVLYYANPLFGYRLQPNQDLERKKGIQIRINNLGLRAKHDWDNNIQNKILFLGDSVTYGGSYISNDNLFSEQSIKNIPTYQSGNAAVNAWGVENIYGLIADAKFMPAKIYITVLPEEDFYRGFVRIKGYPFWCKSPKYALKELFFYILHKKIYIDRYQSKAISEKYISKEEIKSIIVEKAVAKLKKLDSLLKSKGYKHLIYISPTKKQVVEKASKDIVLENLLKNNKLNVTYISNKIEALTLSPKEKQNLFHDNVHLTEKGHLLWGRLIEKKLKEIIYN